MTHTRKTHQSLRGQEEVTALLTAFGSPSHRAVTVSRRVAVSPCVVDAQIVQATAAAAQLYGYAQPDAVVGSWQSSLQHPADVRLSRDMAIRRHFGYDQIPYNYVVRVRQGSTTRYRRVLKHTTQLEVAGDTYWVTVLEATRAPLLAETMDVAAQFPLPDSDEVQQYSGIMSVAEMVARIQRFYPAAQQHVAALTAAAFYPSMSALQTPPSIHQRDLGEAVIAFLQLTPGYTVALDDGLFLHRCQKCGGVWISPQVEPVKCPRQRADAQGPKCGTRRWRVREE